MSLCLAKPGIGIAYSEQTLSNSDQEFEESDIYNYEMGVKRAYIKKNNYFHLAIDQFTPREQSYSGKISYSLSVKIAKEMLLEKVDGLQIFILKNRQIHILYHKYKNGQLDEKEIFMLKKELCPTIHKIEIGKEQKIEKMVDLKKFNILHYNLIIDSSPLCSVDAKLQNVYIDLGFEVTMYDQNQQYFDVLKCTFLLIKRFGSWAFFPCYVNFLEFHSLSKEPETY